MSLPPAERAALTVACLEHLRHEMAAQETFQALLAQQHAALLASDFQAFSAATSRREELAELADSIESARAAFRRQCGASLGLPPAEVTLTRLACLVGEPFSSQIRSTQSRLRELAAGTESILHRVTTILAFCGSYTRNLLSSIVEGDPLPDRYGPGGTRLHAGPEVAGVVSGVA